MNPIPTSTVKELHDALVQAWNELSAAIDASSPIWDERLLESEDAGADAWSPRLAAWHAIAGERIRAAYIEYLVTRHPAAPGDMMDFAASAAASDASVDALRAEFRKTRTPADMHEALMTGRVAMNRCLQGLTDTDLDVAASVSDFVREYVSDRGQAPTPDVRGSLLHGVVHLTDHAGQIQRASPSR